ncbi:cellulose binding domain-containing protein [Streptacidiphilus monticola]
MEHAPVRPGRLRRALVAATALACAATGLYATTRPAHADTPALSVQYKTSTAANGYEIEPWFKVVNNSASSVPLNQVVLRYYFTADYAGSYVFACAWAVVGCGSVSGTVVTMPTPTATADHYLELRFSGGTLAPGADSGDLQLRLYRSDWQNVNQANDWSFNGADTDYALWDHVTAYRNGSLTWGTPPVPDGSPSPSPSPSPRAGAAPPPRRPPGRPCSTTSATPPPPIRSSPPTAGRCGPARAAPASRTPGPPPRSPSRTTAPRATGASCSSRPPPTAPAPAPPRPRSTPATASSSRAPTPPGCTSTTPPAPAPTATTSTRPSTPSPRTTRSTASWTTSTCPTAAGARPAPPSTPPPGTAPTPWTGSPTTSSPACRAGTRCR